MLDWTYDGGLVCSQGRTGDVSMHVVRSQVVKTASDSDIFTALAFLHSKLAVFS